MDRNLALELVRVTEAAALSSGRWVGKGDKIAADRAATEANRNLVTSSPLIYLVKDMSERDRTRSARLLRYVYLADGRLVEAELVAGGWAAPVEYPPDVRFAKTFRQFDVQAAKRRTGFWSPIATAGSAARCQTRAVSSSAAEVRSVVMAAWSAVAEAL